MTGKAVPYRTRGTPPAIGVFHVPFPIPHHGVTEEDALKALSPYLQGRYRAAEEVAAIVIEPVQGEGGFYQTPISFMKKLRDICDSHGICLVADEVQTGFARTGKVFAIEHYDIEPDLIPIAKALGGGFPISGVIGKAEIMDAAEPGGLRRHLWRQSDLGRGGAGRSRCDRGRGAVRPGQSDRRGMVDRLKTFRQSNTLRPIGDVRGLGAMVAFELVKERGTHERRSRRDQAVTAAALDAGLILLSCGYYGNTIRIAGAR